MLSYKRRICSDTSRWPELVWLHRFPQAAYRPRDIAKQREPTRTSDKLERQFRGGFRAFVQVSALGCIDLGDRRSRVQISAARPIRTAGHSTLWDVCAGRRFGVHRSGGPKVPSSNLGSPTNKSVGQDRSLGAGPPGCFLALPVLLLGSAELFALKQEP